MEALQMLKFTIKKDCLNFTQDWITAEGSMTKQEPDQDIDLLTLLLNNGQADDILNRIICDFGDNDGSTL